MHTLCCVLRSVPYQRHHTMVGDHISLGLRCNAQDDEDESSENEDGDAEEGEAAAGKGENDTEDEEEVEVRQGAFDTIRD